MKVIIKPAFKRDRDSVSSIELLEALGSKLDQIEKAKSIENITGLKPLTGYVTLYRIYVKTPRHSYRIGAIIRNNTIWLIRFLPRKKIYRQFP